MKRAGLFLLGLSYFFLSSCTQDFQPKPYSYYRIDLPEHEYRSLGSGFSFAFEIPTYSKVLKCPEPNWLNLHFEQFDAQIHLTYKTVNGDLIDYLEESRALAFNHTQKAEGIKETVYHNDLNDVHGLLYEIEGNAASSVQFYLTDSVNHFLRGALYFNAIPNPDSIAPVNDFILEDIIHLMETTYWTTGSGPSDR